MADRVSAWRITAAILEAHNGRIELHTASLRGTTFRVLLPLA